MTAYYKNYCPITNHDGLYAANVPKETTQELLSRGALYRALHQVTYLAHQGLRYGVISPDEAVGDGSALHALVHVLDGVYHVDSSEDVWTDEIIALAMALEDVVLPAIKANQ